MNTCGCKILLREVEKQTGTKVVDAAEIGDNCDIIIVQFNKKVKRQEELLREFLFGKSVYVVENTHAIFNLESNLTNWMCKKGKWVA